MISRLEAVSANLKRMMMEIPAARSRLHPLWSSVEATAAKYRTSAHKF
jgi:hypothetical protein